MATHAQTHHPDRRRHWRTRAGISDSNPGQAGLASLAAVPIVGGIGRSFLPGRRVARARVWGNSLAECAHCQVRLVYGQFQDCHGPGLGSAPLQLVGQSRPKRHWVALERHNPIPLWRRSPAEWPHPVDVGRQFYPFFQRRVRIAQFWHQYFIWMGGRYLVAGGFVQKGFSESE